MIVTMMGSAVVPLTVDRYVASRGRIGRRADLWPSPGCGLS